MKIVEGTHFLRILQQPFAAPPRSNSSCVRYENTSGARKKQPSIDVATAKAMRQKKIIPFGMKISFYCKH